VAHGWVTHTLRINVNIDLNLKQNISKPSISKLQKYNFKGHEFSLRWQDSKARVNLMREELKLNQDSRKEFYQMGTQLIELKNIPLWVKMSSEVLETNLYDLYMVYLKQDKKIGLDFFSPNQVSFITSQGPFKSISLIECLHADKMSSFVDYLLLMDDEFNAREFRLRTNIPVQIAVNENVVVDANFTQMTTEGTLFKLNITDLDIILSSSNLVINFKGSSKNWINTNKDYYSIRMSIDALKDQVFYLFVSEYPQTEKVDPLRNWFLDLKSSESVLSN
jgi:hypothetical protein